MTVFILFVHVCPWSLLFCTSLEKQDWSALDRCRSRHLLCLFSTVNLADSRASLYPPHSHVCHSVECENALSVCAASAGTFSGSCSLCVCVVLNSQTRAVCQRASQMKPSTACASAKARNIAAQRRFGVMEAGMLPRTPAVGLARRRKAVCEHRLSEVDGEDDFAGVSSPSATFYPSFAQMEQILSPTGELLETICLYRRGVVTTLCAINHGEPSW